jgi:hypothetical protein
MFVGIELAVPRPGSTGSGTGIEILLPGTTTPESGYQQHDVSIYQRGGSRHEKVDRIASGDGPVRAAGDGVQ